MPPHTHLYNCSHLCNHPDLISKLVYKIANPHWVLTVTVQFMTSILCQLTSQTDRHAHHNTQLSKHRRTDRVTYAWLSADSHAYSYSIQV